MSKSMRDQRDALFSTIMALLTASPLVSQLIIYHYRKQKGSSERSEYVLLRELW
jgi:hypothetical protein